MLKTVKIIKEQKKIKIVKEILHESTPKEIRTYTKNTEETTTNLVYKITIEIH